MTPSPRSARAHPRQPTAPSRARLRRPRPGRDRHPRFDQKQALLRLVVEEVHVTGWHVQIRLRIPLDDNPDGPPRPPNPKPGPDRPSPMSIEDRLRSLGSPPRDLPAPSARPTTHPTADPGPGVTTCPRGSPGRCCAARYARRPNATARRPTGQRTNGPDQSRHLRRPQSSGRKKFQKVTHARAGARRPGRAHACAGATGPGRVGDRRMSGSRPAKRGGVAAERSGSPPAMADNRHRVLTTDQLTAMDFPSTRFGSTGRIAEIGRPAATPGVGKHRGPRS